MSMSQDIDGDFEPNNIEGEGGSGDGHDITNRLTQQKQHWKEKAQKAEAAAEEYKQKISDLEGRVTHTQEEVQAQTLSTRYGLDAQDVKVLKNLAAGDGKTPEEMLESEEFIAYREGKSLKGRGGDVVPEPSTSIPVVGDKSFRELSTQERGKNYSQTIQKMIEKGRNKHRNIT